MSAPARPHVFLANPMRGEGYLSAKAQLLAVTRQPTWVFHHFEMASSLLTWSFNCAWAQALNLRDRGAITHFLLIHSDVVPRQPTWLEELLALLAEHQAQTLSAIIPIKSTRGLTSTAHDTDPWRPQRVTMTEAHALPPTWTAPDLLFNTGLLLVDFRDLWVEQVCFTMRDRIERSPEGAWRALVEPEDWHFSRQCRALGVRSYVTRAVALDHCGFGYWPSDQVWGEPTDDSGPRLRLLHAGVGGDVGRPVQDR